MIDGSVAAAACFSCIKFKNIDLLCWLLGEAVGTLAYAALPVSSRRGRPASGYVVSVCRPAILGS